MTFTDSDNALSVFLGAMYRYCRKAVAAETGDRGVTISNEFGRDLRRIVDEVLTLGDDAVRDDRSGQPRGVVRSKPGNLSGPKVLPLRYDARYIPGSSLRQAMQRFSRVSSVGIRSYVPSGCGTPEYARMETAALEYYLYWREQARSGRYGETDEGYLWLYRCELINAESDDGRALEQLAGLSRAYDGSFGRSRDSIRRIPGETYLDYALLKRPDDLDPTVRPCPVSSAVLLRMLLEGRDPPACADNILTLASIGSSKEDKGIRASFTDDCARIAARVIARINRICIDKGGQVSGFCGLKSRDEERPVFGGLRYFGGSSRISLQLPCYEDNPRFQEGTRTLVRNVARAVQERGRPLKPVWICGAEASDIIVEESERWFSEKQSAAKREAARPSLIDRSAVDAAEEDLKRVTELMGTEEDAAGEPEEAQALPQDVPEPFVAAPVQDWYDPWSALVSRLDKVRRRYLEKVLSGASVDVSTVAEAAINDAAMDTVRDAVVENGRVYEDYADDLRRALASRMPMEDRWDAFVKRIGEGQREYLGRIVSGVCVSSKPVLEASINRTAMEVLGRTVVENGRVPSECIPAMRKLFSGRKRRCRRDLRRSHGEGVLLHGVRVRCPGGPPRAAVGDRGYAWVGAPVHRVVPQARPRGLRRCTARILPVVQGQLHGRQGPDDGRGLFRAPSGGADQQPQRSGRDDGASPPLSRGLLGQGYRRIPRRRHRRGRHVQLCRRQRSRPAPHEVHMEPLVRMAEGHGIRDPPAVAGAY